MSTAADLATAIAAIVDQRQDPATEGVTPREWADYRKMDVRKARDELYGNAQQGKLKLVRVARKKRDGVLQPMWGFVPVTGK